MKKFIFVILLIINCSMPVFAEENKENNFTVGGTYISNCDLETYNQKLYKVVIISDNENIKELDSLIRLLDNLRLEIEQREKEKN